MSLCMSSNIYLNFNTGKRSFFGLFYTGEWSQSLIYLFENR